MANDASTNVIMCSIAAKFPLVFIVFGQMFCVLLSRDNSSSLPNLSLAVFFFQMIWESIRIESRIRRINGKLVNSFHWWIAAQSKSPIQMTKNVCNSIVECFFQPNNSNETVHCFGANELCKRTFVRVQCAASVLCQRTTYTAFNTEKM